jgi:hypothetical protein
MKNLRDEKVDAVEAVEHRPGTGGGPPPAKRKPGLLIDVYVTSI